MATSKIADTDTKLEFVRQATERMAEHTHPVIASIVGDDGATHRPHVGSAFRLDDRRAIVTAAHVYREARQRFGGQVAASGERGKPPAILGTPRVIDDTLDIAVFDVPAIRRAALHSGHPIGQRRTIPSLLPTTCSCTVFPAFVLASVR